MKLVIYVPKDGTHAEQVIKRGSGIVGSPDPRDPELITIDYEGNLYGAQNLGRFVERLLSAADRHVHRYPTRARMVVRREDLSAVGTFDTETRKIEYSDEVGWLTLTHWYESPNLEGAPR